MLTIWRFTDGKRGHENQSLGLAEALCRLTNCRVETLHGTGGWLNVFNWLTGRFPAGNNLPKPDLIIGAGHATHWPMLAARRAHGGKIAVLMKPSLPLSWFDWVLMPEHDLSGRLHPHPNPPPSRGREDNGQPPPSRGRGNNGRPPPSRGRENNMQPLPSREKGQILTTQGAINRVLPGSACRQQQGLMLIGGPSAEYGWSEAALLKQIHLIALHHPETHWHLTTSRRTPAGFLADLARLGLSNVKAFAHDEVDAGWLPAQLAQAAQVWVTPDSASMVYEALSSGAAVGCFELPYARPGRVARGLEKLVREKRLTGFPDWERSGKLQANTQALNEADRCARQLLSYLTNTPSPLSEEGITHATAPLRGESIPHAPSPLRGEGWGGGEMPEQANNPTLPLPPPLKGGGIKKGSPSSQEGGETSSARQLTVVQILPALQSGGVERGTLEVGKHLVEHGHRSIVISAGGRMVEQLVREGSEHVTWDIGKKSLWTLRLIPKLRRFLTENKVDILHARSRMPAWICYLAWKGMDPKTRPRFVTTVHGPYSVNAYSAVMTRGERVIVISEMIREYALKNYPGTDPGKLRLIYRGVDPEAFPHGYKPDQAWLEKWYAQFPQTRDKKLITLPARITRWKGQEDFIELMAQIKEAHPEAHGLIVGEAKGGKSRFLDELKEKAASLGVSDRITFIGHRGDLREIMAVSSVVLSLSREPEAFGRTTVEALSLGVPVIGYNHGGVGEQLAAILPEGGVPAGDISTAAKNAADWLAAPPALPANQPFTLEKMLDSTLSMYNEIAFSTIAGHRR